MPAFMLIILCTIVTTPILIRFILQILQNPFSFPYFSQSFDVTGKRNVKIEDYIDNFIRDKDNWILLQRHQDSIKEWKKETENRIQNCKLRKYRTKQFNKVLDEDHAYHFKLTRKQTRYKQKNYIKESYIVISTDSEWTANWPWLKNRYQQLKEISFEATLREYESKNQRNLMTKALRKAIMERDCYTCQICGKRMPDEVGLHIDHIIPIAKGGKSIPSNLRVLCSKCNGSKGAK